ncbi:O-antigen ligase family protein [Verrucomicrobiaceae bacterium N1E253]|uniref:O-antigen ligase family protein n=1 Tax=Oceaniferula marina TaxID=2748318 RepID=A0A851GJ08_9BACT|nr:O-antigen ligase family protein [Oceaniferula marina]NWK55175.1 O-antigen ligase family protein [Oceaniferula marina]
MNIYKRKSNRLGAVDLRLVLALITGLGFAVFVGTVVGSGEYKEAYIYVLLLVGVGIMATMKRSFWMLIPFSMVGDFPAVPVGPVSMKLGEAWLFVSLLFVVLQAVSRRKLPILYVRGALPVYLYSTWVFMIYILNPVGLSSMGASEGGLRFYMMIGLSLLSVVILMNQVIDSQKAKKVLMLVLVGAIMGSAWNIAQVFFPAMAVFSGRSVMESGGGFYGWNQQLSIVPHLIVIFIVSRYSFRMMLIPTNWWVVVLYILCIGLGFASGKRSFTVLMLIYPILGTVLRKEFIAVFLCGAMTILIVSVALIGHGSIFHLPKTAQRVLSVLPVGEWDGDVQASADNDFRETLNKYALRDISERPILGEGLQADFDLLWHLRYNPGDVLEEGDHILGLTYSANSAWHNTWLGISADFGIPAAVIWASVWITLIIGCMKSIKQLSIYDWRYTLLMFILLLTLGDLLRSWQFGHSAVNMWQVAWRVGVWLAVKRTLTSVDADKKCPIVGYEVKRRHEGLLQH